MTSSLRFEVPTALEYFQALVAEDASLPLLEAAISIAQDEFPLLDVQAVLAEVDALGAKLRARIPADSSPAHKLRWLNAYFYQELGFAGNVNHFYDVHNSYVHQVLVRRRGIPITLGLIYAELAGQIGLLARGLCFPGHYLVKLRLSEGEAVLDPFTGLSLTREHLEELLTPLRHGLEPDGREDAGKGRTGASPISLGAYLQAATPRETLVRMLRNLKDIHRSHLDWPRVLNVMQRLVLLLPQDPAERRDRGQAYEHVHLTDAAVADYKAYLQACPEASDHHSVSLRVQALTGGAGRVSRSR